MTQGKGLTPKQQRFVELVALEGLMLVDAYRQAYDTSRMTDKTAHESASKLAADPKVSARIEALRAELQERAVEKELWSRVDSIAVLKGIATDQESRGNEKVSAVKELNAMHGFSVTKVEHSGVITTKLDDLTPGQIVNASLALLRMHCNGLERGRIVDFARSVMEGEGYDFT